MRSERIWIAKPSKEKRPHPKEIVRLLRECDGSYRVLRVADESIREAHTLHVDRHIGAKKVCEVMKQLIGQHEAPRSEGARPVSIKVSTTSSAGNASDRRSSTP